MGAVPSTLARGWTYLTLPNPTPIARKLVSTTRLVEDGHSRPAVVFRSRIVSSRYDPFPPAVFEAARMMREAMSPSSALNAQMQAIGNVSALHLVERARIDAAMHRALLPPPGLMDRFSLIGDAVLRRAEEERRLGALIAPSVFEHAKSMATLAQNLALPSTMERFRTPVPDLTSRMLGLRSFELLCQPEYMDAFNRAAAMSDVLAGSMRVGRELREATEVFAAGAMPAFPTLAGYREFLDASGLRLPRWPQVRLLTAAEKRRRLKARLKGNAEPAHVRSARSLNHRYEATLRDILDAAMADAYGEDWPETRLPLCECNDLLGRWRKRGGDVLEHADYAHYERIMGHPDHFATVFEAGFDDPAVLVDLLKQAGRLRAASHHGRAFTQEDLRDLRLTWRTIEAGLIAFTDDYEV